MIPLHKVFMSSDVMDYLGDITQSGYIGQGDAVEEFEGYLKQYWNNPYVVTVNSATSGLHLALHLLNLPIGSGVLTTPLTCFATSAAIRSNLLTPVWVDVDPSTLNMDLDDLTNKITPNTKAIMAVHFAGNPIDLKKLYEISSEFNIPVIEDCAHALGAKFNDLYLGTHDQKITRIAVYSFQAVKPLTTGDGGAMILPQSLYDRAKRLRWYGIDRKDRARPVTEWGYKFHMNNIAASIGMANFPYLGEIIKKQQENAEYYEGSFINHISYNIHSKPSHYLFPILIDRRADFIRHMAEQGIETGPVHTRNDLEPCFNFLRQPTPMLDEFCDKIVCLPVGWWVGEEEREQITEAYYKGW